MPAKISLLALLLNSEAHRKALFRILNQSYVSQNITVANLEHLAENITAPEYISFTEEEIPPGGRGNYKALHISTQCKDHVVARVLIDNGSALNVMPLETLMKLPVDQSLLRKNQLVVRAFDGTRREVVGEMTISMMIGPVEFEILFQIMDIQPTYSCLLGRPWIHMAGAVPSSLHQKVKFRVANQMISVSGEEDIMVMQPPNAPYVEAAEEAIDCSFKSFEVVNVTYVGEGSKVPIPHMSDCLNMQLKMTIGKGYHVGNGLGRQCQGIKKPITLPRHDATYGLGFTPTRKTRSEVIEEKRRRRMAALKGEEPEMRRIEFPPLYSSFISAGWINPSQSMTLEEDFTDLSISVMEKGESSSGSGSQWVRRMEPGVSLNNWEVMEMPTFFTSSEM